MSFSWNVVTDLRDMWQYAFMRNAFEAGTVIAIVAGIIGYFVVLRRSAFATHALGHTGFSGAAGAVLFGVNPVYGLLLFTCSTGSGIALLGNRASHRDVEIGTVLAFALGVGLLFLSLYQGFATEAYSILFGEVLGISASGVVFTLEASAVVLLVMAFIARPLLFSSLDEDVAEAKGMPMLFLGVVFMLLLAVTISIAVQIIGVLLIFALMVTPAAIAVRLTKRPLFAVALSVLIAVTATWSGLFVSWYEPYPVSFFIVGIVFALYVTVRSIDVLQGSKALRPTRASETTSVATLKAASLVGLAAQVLLGLGFVWLIPHILATGPAITPLGESVDPALVLLFGGAVLGLVAAFLFFRGFRGAKAVDPGLGSPTVLVLLGLAGYGLALAGEGLLLGGVVSAFGSPSSPLGALTALAGIGLLGLGLILAVLGSLGWALGNWRVGERYGQPSLKVGAILSFVPVVSPAGFALCSFGYVRAGRKLADRGPPSLPKLAA